MPSFRKPYKVLVTGGAGFIGSHLTDELIRSGEEVVVVDNLSTGRLDNLSHRANFHNLDIFGDRGKIEKLFKQEKFDYVFHLAAMARIPECLDKPIESFNINVAGTLHLLQLAREYKTGFVFSSSSSVYGDITTELPISEDNRLAPISMYGLHKLAAEQLVLQYAKFYGVTASALRYFNVYGSKRQSEQGAYPNVFSAFNRDSKKGIFTIYGDGEQKRDYVHVFDVVRANMRFLYTDGAWGRVFNVGTGECHTVNEIAGYFDIGKASYEPARPADPRYSCADVRRAGEILGWRPAIGFTEGVDLYFKSVKGIL